MGESLAASAAAFAAVKSDGSVVCWGSPEAGGLMGVNVKQKLNSGVRKVFASKQAFAALKDDGSVVSWGHGMMGGDSRSVANQLLSGVQNIYATDGAFAAVKIDGSIVTWGPPRFGGRSKTSSEPRGADDAIGMLLSLCRAMNATFESAAVDDQ